jgi:hypothetical protein
MKVCLRGSGRAKSPEGHSLWKFVSGAEGTRKVLIMKVCLHRTVQTMGEAGGRPHYEGLPLGQRVDYGGSREAWVWRKAFIMKVCLQGRRAGDKAPVGPSL